MFATRWFPKEQVAVKLAYGVYGVLKKYEEI